MIDVSWLGIVAGVGVGIAGRYALAANEARMARRATDPQPQPAPAATAVQTGPEVPPRRPLVRPSVPVAVRR